MKKVLGLLSITLVVIFWGISFISLESILHVVSPTVLGFFRYVLATLFVGAIAVAKRVNLRITKADLFVFFLAGLLGIFLYSVLESAALLYISPAAASIMTALAPMAMVIGNYVVYRETISKKEIFLILISVFGVYLVLYTDLEAASSWKEIIGYLLMLASIISWTVYSLLTKKTSQKYNSLKVTAIQSFMALLIFIPSLIFSPLPDFIAFSALDWVNLLFLGIICSGACYYLYIHSVNTLGVTIPNLFLNFIPIITILVNVIVFGAAIDIYQIIGGVIVTGSMTLMTIENLNKAKES
jgi:drug/metabolite transporter (DMT)-like permease